MKHKIIFFLHLIIGDLPSSDHFENLEFVDIKTNCTRLTEEQIKKEITASLKYLSYAAFFSQDDINRPGFANFFFNAASEEREHAEKLIEYLSMRGRYFVDPENKISGINIGQLIKNSEKADALGLQGKLYMPKEHSAESSAGLKALKSALAMEFAVTKSIRVLIEACEAENVGNAQVFNDYHVS
jgi:ferritin heavy chain